MVVLEILNWKSVSINVRLMTHVFFKDFKQITIIE